MKLMSKYYIYLIILSLIFHFSSQNEIESEEFINFDKINEENTNSSNLKEWLSKLVIDLPNELIKNATSNRLENLTIYNISLDNISATSPEKIGNKVGIKISVKNSSINLKGIYSILTGPKNFIAHISKLNVEIPFYLVRDSKTGLVSEVDTSGFNLDIDHADIDFELEMPDLVKNIVVGLLRIVLGIIKTNIIEKNLINTMNTEFMKLFEKANNIILNGVEPEELYIILEEPNRSNLKKSSLINAVGYLLNNLTGANGPLSLNHLVNLVTENSGIIRLHEFYNESIHFEFNLTDKSNSSLGYYNIGLEDLNVSGLNTWKNFNALEPYDNISLSTFTNLQNLTINITFSIRLKLDNTSNFAKEEVILYEKANFRTNLENNKLNAMVQLPIDKRKFNQYSDRECLNLDCIVDIADSNGTGVSALSLKETFTYIILEVEKRDGSLEEDLDDTIDKILELFITSFSDEIGYFINALLNTTVINLANEQINNYLYSKTCPGIPDPDDSEVNVFMTSLSFILVVVIFILLIFFPYIKGRALGKGDKINEALLDEEKEKVKTSESSEIEKVKNVESRYCIESISIQWIKEFGRTDPNGASLFLHPQIPVFWRIFIPLAILSAIAFFVSSNSSNGASVFVVFDVGRRIQIPSLFDFGLINSIREMYKAKVYFLAFIVLVFSGIWPYLKLILMLISFALPASLLSKRKRENILMALDATGKWSILDSYVLILMLVAFHFHIEFPLIPQSEAENGSVINVYVYAAYGFFSLILGTIMSLGLSHIITYLHRSLDEHPDQNKGEKAEGYTALIKFAKSKWIGDLPFRIFISFLLFFTLILLIIGSFITSFSFHFHGLAGYALDLFQISAEREYSVIDLGLSVPKSYENPDDKIIKTTQIIYFLTIFVMPVSTLISLIFLWFTPLPRRAQKICFTVCEILNAWSCLDVFILSIIAAILQISQFTAFIVGDKCDFIDPYIDKYFYNVLDGHNTCFEVKAYLQSGAWILFVAAITFFIVSYFVRKICRNALDERLPDNVREYLENKKKQKKLGNIINENNSGRETLIQLSNNEKNNNINDTISSNNNE